MKIHRFIGNPENPEIYRQIKKVLKLKPGEKAIFSDGNGKDELMEYQDDRSWKFLKKLDPIQPSRKVHLYLAILKKENFELAVQKAVECGVISITPIITERTVKTGLNTTRLEKIILEACEQSGRSIVPTLSPILDFKDALQKGSNSEERIIFHFVDNTYNPKKEASATSIFIGPEGGFGDQEINMAKESGYSLASLGQFTLRGETAAIVGTYRAVQGF